MYSTKNSNYALMKPNVWVKNQKNDELIDKFDKGHYDILKHRLDTRESMNNNTVLHNIVNSTNEDNAIVKFLSININVKSIANAVNDEHQTILHLLCKKQYYKLYKIMTDIEYRNKYLELVKDIVKDVINQDNILEFDYFIEDIYGNIPFYYLINGEENNIDVRDISIVDVVADILDNKIYQYTKDGFVFSLKDNNYVFMMTNEKFIDDYVKVAKEQNKEHHINRTIVNKANKVNYALFKKTKDNMIKYPIWVCKFICKMLKYEDDGYDMNKVYSIVFKNNVSEIISELVNNQDFKDVMKDDVLRNIFQIILFYQFNNSKKTMNLNMLVRYVNNNNVDKKIKNVVKLMLSISLLNNMKDNINTDIASIKDNITDETLKNNSVYKIYNNLIKNVDIGMLNLDNKMKEILMINGMFVKLFNYDIIGYKSSYGIKNLFKLLDISKEKLSDSIEEQQILINKNNLDYNKLTKYRNNENETKKIKNNIINRILSNVDKLTDDECNYLFECNKETINKMFKNKTSFDTAITNEANVVIVRRIINFAFQSNRIFQSIKQMNLGYNEIKVRDVVNDNKSRRNAIIVEFFEDIKKNILVDEYHRNTKTKWFNDLNNVGGNYINQLNNYFLDGIAFRDNVNFVNNLQYVAFNDFFNFINENDVYDVKVEDVANLNLLKITITNTISNATKEYHIRKDNNTNDNIKERFEKIIEKIKVNKKESSKYANVKPYYIVNDFDKEFFDYLDDNLINELKSFGLIISYDVLDNLIKMKDDVKDNDVYQLRQDAKDDKENEKIINFYQSNIYRINNIIFDRLKEQ